MKKVLLLSLSLVMGLCAFAQKTVVKSLPEPVKAKLERQSLGNDVVVGTANFEVRGTQSVVVNEDEERYYYDVESMYTTYDLQSNSVIANRMYQTEDGSVAVVQTMSSSEYDDEFLDRGTGYNFAAQGLVGKFSAVPETRIEANATGEDVRTGWPTIAPYGKEGEILVNHGHEKGLAYYIREKAGEGEWDGPHAIPNPENIDEVVKGKDNTLAWARVATTGENNEVVHIFANASGDTNIACYYLRTENLNDWKIDFAPVVMDSLHINCYAADDYSVSVNGDNIAVLFCAGFSQHVMLYESNDAGLTWTSRMVWECPVDTEEWYVAEEEGGDYTIEKMYGPTQGSVAIGADGVSHVALAVSMYDIKPGGYYTLYYGITCDGIAYWNDTTCWEMGVQKVVDSLKLKDSTEVVKYEHEYDSVWTLLDSTFVKYEYEYDSVWTLIDSTEVEGEWVKNYDSVWTLIDSTAKYEYEYDSVWTLVDSAEVNVYEYEYDSVWTLLDSTLVGGEWEKNYDSVWTLIDSTEVEGEWVKNYDSVWTLIDSTLVGGEWEKNYDSVWTLLDSTLLYEYIYDTTYRYDTVGVPSPIRSPLDDELKHALRLWWTDPEDTTMMVMYFTNFCAITPVHTEQGFAGFDHNSLYTGSGDEAGDYLLAFGVCAYPSIAVDPAGNLAIAYSAPDVNRDLYNGQYYMRSLFVNYRPVDSLYWGSWGEFSILAPHNFYEEYIHSNDECTFVSAVSTPVKENEFWFSCLSDDTPGFYSGNYTSQNNISKSTVNVFKYSPVAAVDSTYDGVNETIDVVYNIYPNPASDYIVIASSMDANAKVTFTNIAGQTVKVVDMSLTTGNNTIVVSDLTSGVYFCTVTANGYSHTSKVVVK